MKNNGAFFGFITFYIIFSGGSCDNDKSDQQSLPPITAVGANLFGCVINGRIIVPRNGNGTFNVTDSGMIFWKSPDGSNTYNDIDVHDYASEKSSNINLHIVHLKEVGAYTINESNCTKGFDSPLTTNMYCRVYDYQEKIYKQYCSYPNSGVITINRYDEKNRIVSGTFSGMARNINDIDDAIEISEGRFDIKWDTVSNEIFP